MVAVENFGDTPEAFDFDSWLDQGARPQREVTIYRDWSLLAEYDRLTAEAGKAGDDEAMGEASLADRQQEILDRMEASKLVLVIQSLTNAETKALAEKAPTKTVDLGDGKTREKVDEVALGDMIAAASIISHDLTAEQIGRMRDKLGDGPMHALYKGVAEMRTAGQELPSIPFSAER